MITLPPAARPMPVACTAGWERSFPGREASAPLVRAEVTATLPAPLRHRAAQCISELTSNSIIHSRSGQPDGTFTVRVGQDEAGWLVEVIDDGADPDPTAEDGPVAEPGVDPPEHGRGLDLVDAFADERGENDLPGGRHRAWFRLNRPTLTDTTPARRTGCAD